MISRELLYQHIDEIREMMTAAGWGKMLTPEQTVEIFVRASHCSICTMHGKIVGIIRSMDDGMWHANIDCLLVSPEYRHRGIGKGLVQQLIKTLKDAGIQTVTVAVNEEKNAPLYEANGFHRVKDGAILQIDL